MTARSRRYEEIEVRIEPSPGGYVVRASTGAGDAQERFALTLSRDRIEYLVLRAAFPRRGRRRLDGGPLDEVTELGRELFAALFSGDVRDLYRAALAQAESADGGLRVKLALNSVPELMGLPWEFLYDEPSFLSISQLTPVVRYLDLPRTRRPRALEPPLRILGVVSSPSDAETLDAAQERANLESAVADLTGSGEVEVHWLPAATLPCLLEELRRGTYHVLHYVGHGAFRRDRDEGVLVFEDDEGRAREVGAVRLGMILRDHDSLRLAVLNACEGARGSDADPYSGVGATLVRQGIPAVIAMQFEITDRAAIICARNLYGSLAAGYSIDAALAEARKGIWADDNDVEWATPVLLTRVGDGRLFDIREHEPPPAPPETRIALALEPHAREVAAGETVRWRARLENPGPEPVAGVDLRDGSGSIVAGPFDLEPGETRIVSWTTTPAADERQVITLGRPGGDAVAGQQVSASVTVRPGPPPAAAPAGGHDLFIAHAGADAGSARRLHALLAPRARVFLDVVDLQLGDDWDRALSEAQRGSLITVVLVSDRTDAAFYQREEIAAAIDLARDPATGHRVVPVYLDGPSGRAKAPYGLRLKHGVELGGETTLETAAERLHALVRRIRGGAAPAPEPEAAGAPEPLVEVGHADIVRALAFSADGKRFATGSNDKTAVVWGAADGARLTTLDHSGTLMAGYVTSVAFSPDGRLLATGTDGRGACVWELEGPRLRHRLQQSWGLHLHSVAFSPDGRRLAAGRNGPQAFVWDVESGELVREIPHADWVRAVAFTGDERLITACDDKFARVFELGDGAELLRLEHGSWIHALAVSPDGRTLATGSKEGARLWQLGTGAELPAPRHEGTVNSVAFGGDGRLVASACDKLARVWEPGSEQAGFSVAHEFTVAAVALSPDGRRLATASRQARIWGVP
jgi:hypothetical protein